MRFLAIAIVLFTIAAACGDDEDAGDSGSSATTRPADPETEVLGPVDRATGAAVRVGLISEGQTPTIDNTIELEVAEATVEYINERLAGIAGRPVELVVCETRLDPARAADCAAEMVQADVVAVTIGSLSLLEQVFEALDSSGIPVMLYGAGSPDVLADDDNAFVLSNSAAALFDLPITVAEDNELDKVTGVIIEVPAATGPWEASENVTRFEDAGLELEVVTIPLGTADMTPQMQRIVADGESAIHVVGNDAFCIAAFNGLRAVGYSEGAISTVSTCLSDATRQAVPAEFLEGISIGSPVPVGVEDDSTLLYRTVVETYGSGIDTSVVDGVGMFVAVAALRAGLEELSGDVTPDSVRETLKSMPWIELPGAGGLHFRCNGKAVDGRPGVCVRGALQGTVGEDGQVASFEVINDARIED